MCWKKFPLQLKAVATMLPRICSDGAGEPYVMMLFVQRNFFERADSCVCSDCKAALKKIMNLLERHPGSERLQDQVSKIRAKWL